VRRPVWVEVGGRMKKGEIEEAKNRQKELLTVVTNRRLKRDKPRSQTYSIPHESYLNNGPQREI
jgi:hypothetical protein